MTVRRVSLSFAAAFLAAGMVAVAATAAAPAPKPAPKPGASQSTITANPCNDGTGKREKGCKVTAGPWVAVPASGEADFLLECPKRSGTVTGTDVLASSTDVRVVWEGNPGSPVRPGTSTSFFVFFRGTSAHGEPGLYQPYIGCIPSQKPKPQSLLSARLTITRPGAPLDRRQTVFVLKPGAAQSAYQACGKGEHVLSGWYAVVFGAAKPPDPALGSKAHVTLSIAGGKVEAAVQTDAGVPASAHIELQVGALCST